MVSVFLAPGCGYPPCSVHCFPSIFYAWITADPVFPVPNHFVCYRRDAGLRRMDRQIKKKTILGRKRSKFIAASLDWWHKVKHGSHYWIKRFFQKHLHAELNFPPFLLFCTSLVPGSFLMSICLLCCLSFPYLRLLYVCFTHRKSIIAI